MIDVKDKCIRICNEYFCYECPLSIPETKYCYYAIVDGSVNVCREKNDTAVNKIDAVYREMFGDKIAVTENDIAAVFEE